jgi:hypothetical protein
VLTWLGNFSHKKHKKLKNSAEIDLSFWCFFVA